jgi:hypothetical protein
MLNKMFGTRAVGACSVSGSSKWFKKEIFVLKLANQNDVFCQKIFHTNFNINLQKELEKFVKNFTFYYFGNMHFAKFREINFNSV